MANVWVFLCCSIEIDLLKVLSADCVLEERQVVEGLLFVQISAAFSKLGCKRSKDIFNPTRANLVKNSTKCALCRVVT